MDPGQPGPAVQPGQQDWPVTANLQREGTLKLRSGMRREASLVQDPVDLSTFMLSRHQSLPQMGPGLDADADGGAIADENYAADPLCIGDIITLYDDHNHGFVGSRVSAIHDGVVSVAKSRCGGRPIGRDVSEVLFQVQAAERYKCTKSYHAALQRAIRLHEAEQQASGRAAARGLDDSEEWKDGDMDREALESMLIAGNADLAEMRAKADQEVDDNNDMQIRLFGEPLYYGQQIQLLHTRSRNHLEMDPVAPSALEPENMRVNLRNSLSRNISLTIEPRFKVRSKGERVRQGDKVVFQSNKVVGQYLHTSLRVYPSTHQLSGEHELSLSVVKTMYTVRVFSRACNSQKPVKPPPPLPLAPVIPTAPHEPTRKIRGGDVVQLFHRELDGYIAAESAFDDSNLSHTVGQEVHLRIRKPDAERPHRLSPPTSAVSFWRVELELQLTAGPIEYGAKVRFRHMLTGFYLGIDEKRTIDEEEVTGTAGPDSRELQVVLVPLSSDTPADIVDGTLFSFVAVANDTGTDVFSGMMARLLHCKTGGWVHGANFSEVRRVLGAKTRFSMTNDHFFEFEQRLGKIQWDKAPLCNVSVVNELLFEDAYQVSVVENSLIQDAQFVADTIPVLSHFVRWRRERELSPTEYESTRTTLHRLRDFMYISGLNQRTRQKLLRNYCLVDILVSMLRVPFRPYNTSAAGTDLKDLGEHGDLNATIKAVFPVLTAYLDGNSRKNELYAARYIALFFTKMGGFMDVEPLVIEMIRDNHKIISQVGESEIEYIISFITKGSRDPDFLELIAVLCSCDGVPLRINQTLSSERLLDPKSKVFYPMRLHEGEVQVSSNATGGSWGLIELLEQDEDEAKWMHKQVDLLAKLCSGRFDYAIQCITVEKKLITPEICFQCAKNMHLTHALRSAFVELLREAFINVRPHEPALDFVRVIPLTALKSGRRQSAVANTADDFLTQNLFRLDDWIVHVLQDYDGLVASETASNMYLLNVLRILTWLVRFGTYSSEKSVTNMMGPLVSLIDGADDVPSPVPAKFESDTNRQLYNEHVAEWRRHGRFEETRENKVAVDVKVEALNVVRHLFTQQHFYKLRHLVTHMKGIVDWVNTPTSRHSSAPYAGSMEMDCVEKIKHFAKPLSQRDVLRPTLRVRKYLKEVHSQFDFVLAGWSVGDSISDSIVSTLFDLARYKFSTSLRKSLMMISQIFSSTESLLMDASRLMLLTEEVSVQFYNAIQPLLHVLLPMSAGYIEEGDADNFCKIVAFFESKLIIVGAPGVPHAVNQKILFSSGVMQLLLDVLDYDDGQRVDVLLSTFCLLQKLCSQFPEAQSLMFTKLDMILNVACDAGDGSEPMGWENAMAAAVAEMFKDNEQVCLQVTQDHIHTMTSFLARYSIHVPAMVDAMRTTVKAGGIVLKRNQRILIKDLCNTEKQQRCLKPALMMLRENDRDSGKRLESEQWIDRLRSMYVQHFNGRSATYVYHIKMVELIAACCEDSQRFIASMCRSMLPIDVIMAVFVHPTAGADTRALLMRYIWAVFAEDKGIGLGRSLRFWKSLLHCAAHDMATPMSADDFHRQESYLFEAFAPLLIVALRLHFKPQRYPNTAAIHAKLISRIIPIIEASVPHIRQRKHLLAANELLVLIHRDVKADEATIMTLDAAVEEIRSAIQAPVIDGMKDLRDSTALPSEFVERYRDQTFLNDASNIYFANLLRSYRGSNLARVQMAVHGDSVHHALRAIDEKEQYCEEEGSDEYLPLGPEFQHFTALFGNFGKENETEADAIARQNRIECFCRGWDESNHSFGQRSAFEMSEAVTTDIHSVQGIRACLHNFACLGQNRSGLQRELCDLGMTPVLMKMLRLPVEGLVRETLALQVQVMSEGNRSAQETAKEYFLHSREEDFFDQIDAILEDSSDGFENQRSINKQLRHYNEVEARLEALAYHAGTKTKSRPISDSAALGKDVKSILFSRTLDDSDISHASTASGVAAPSMVTEPPRKKSQIVPINEKQSKIESKKLAAAMGTGVKPIAELSVRVLQLLCEGHNNFLQNYLRVQDDNIRSVNLVAKLTKFLALIIQDVRGGTVTLVNQMLETLTETAGGCPPNQKAIVDENVVNELSTLLRMSQRSMTRKGCEFGDASSVHYNCAILLATLLESADGRTATQAVQMADTLDVVAICDRLVEYFVIAKQRGDTEWVCGDDDEPPSARMVAYELHRALLMLEDQTGTDFSIESADVVKDLGALVAARAELSENSLSVEIVRDGLVQKVHFETPEQWRLTSAMKHDVVWNVNRDSATDKIRDFVERARAIENDIKYLKGCERGSIMFAFLIHESNLIRKATMLVTYVLNALILTGWEANDGDLYEVEPTTPSWYPLPFTIFAITHMFLSALLVSAFFIKHPISLRLTVASLPFVGKWLSERVPMPQVECTRQSLFSGASLYHMSFMAASVLGFIFYGYFFCFHLLHICVDNDILGRVIKSVTQNSDSLLWVLALMIIIIYIYSLIAFAFLRESFTPEDGEWCDNEWQCFATSIRLGVMSGAGLGEVLEADQYDGLTPTLRGFYDVSFFIVITVIAMNVVFGIIVDTFSELREEKYAIRDAMENECFICSRKRSEFEQKSKGFRHHTKHEHNMWAYIHFLMYVRSKDPTDFTSHEHFFFDALEDETAYIDAFPVNRSRCLPELDEDGHGPTNETLGAQLNELLQRVDEIAGQLATQPSSRPSTVAGSRGNTFANSA